MSRLGLQILSMVCLLALASLAKAETYTWTDKDGGIHFTDNPYELPEPQRSRVLKQQKENRKRAERETKAIPTTGARDDNDRRQIRHESYRPPDKQRDTVKQTRDSGERLPGGPKVSPLNENKKKRWKAKAAKARKKTDRLQSKCHSLENSRDINQRQHLLFGRPGALADSNKAAENLEKCQENLKKAKHFLEVKLPDMARKAGVPTKWVK
ncbi:MAG: DUF4124 domain-containing protein [Deltaproteobacteria bacterium]|nr:DUF4124 domain-containing protein [Deltaproteobacteria bacterium]